MPPSLSHRPPRSVLMTTDAVGGVWRYTLDLAVGFAEHGVTPILATLGPAPSPAQRAEAAGLRLIETALPLDWTAERPAELDHAAATLARLAGETGVDRVHLHAPALVGHAPWPVPVVAVAHSCVATWWAALRGGALPPDFVWRTEAAAHGLAGAAAIIAPTAAHAAAIQAAYGPHRIEVVHNGTRHPAERLSLSRWRERAGGRVGPQAQATAPAAPPSSQPSPASGRRRSKVARRPGSGCAVFEAGQGEGPATSPNSEASPHPRAILTAGRLWDEAKNTAALDRVAATIDAPIHAAGPTTGPNGAAITLHHLDLLGPLDASAMAAAYTQASVFASLARYEPFGLAVLEAARSGLRLVLSDTPGFRELWDGAATFVAHERDLRPALLAALDAGPDPRAAQRAARYSLDAMVAGSLAVHRSL